MPHLDPSQLTIPFVVQNAQAVAGIGMAVLGSGLIVMVLLSLFGNCGLQQEPADDAYAPAAVAVEVRTTKRKVRSRLVVPSLSRWVHAVIESRPASRLTGPVNHSLSMSATYRMSRGLQTPCKAGIKYRLSCLCTWSASLAMFLLQPAAVGHSSTSDMACTISTESHPTCSCTLIFALLLAHTFLSSCRVSRVNSLPDDQHTCHWQQHKVDVLQLAGL